MTWAKPPAFSYRGAEQAHRPTTLLQLMLQLLARPARGIDRCLHRLIGMLWRFHRAQLDSIHAEQLRGAEDVAAAREHEVNAATVRAGKQAREVHLGCAQR
eukprot:COSAG06_NODE_7313_length_2549_cov_48.716735_4_plen_100_part_01